MSEGNTGLWRKTAGSGNREVGTRGRRVYSVATRVVRGAINARETVSPRNQGGRCGREKNKGKNLLQMYQWKGLENIGGVGGGMGRGEKG